MAEVFAGFIAGFAFSIIVAPAAAILVVRSSHQTGLAQRVAPGGTNIVALAVVLHILAFFVLTALGMIMGLALAGIEDRRPDSGLGSPNIAYTMIVIALAAALVIPAMLFRWRAYALAAALLFITIFGWITPWLARAA